MPDFGFSDVKPENDWRRTTLLDSWSRGGGGNPLGEEDTAGGPILASAVPLEGERPEWTKNSQFQITLEVRSRCYLYLELLEIQTDMRAVEGLQAGPAYQTVGFTVCSGRGNHIKLPGGDGLDVLHTAELKKGDGVYLEMGWVEPSDDKYVVIPYTEVAGIEHKYSITLYTDHEHTFEKINPRLQCEQCGNPSGLYRVLDELEKVHKSLTRVFHREQELHLTGTGGPKQGGGGGPGAWGGFGAAGVTPAGDAALQSALPSGLASGGGRVSSASVTSEDDEGVVSVAELEEYRSSVEQYAQEAHTQYEMQMSKVQQRTAALRQELEQALKEERELEDELRKDYLYHLDDSKSRACVLQ